MPQTLTARRMNLQRANAARLAGAGVRRRVAAGELAFAEAITHSDAQSLRVELLLRSQPSLGRRKAERILTAMYITESKRVRDLTDRQKRLLAAAATQPVTRSNQLRLSIAVDSGELVIA